MKTFYTCGKPQFNQPKKTKGMLIPNVMFLFLLFIGLGSTSIAQTIQIGSGGETSNYIPFYYLYDMGYSQTIYTSDELIAAGMDPSEGLITTIRYKATSSQSTSNWKDWTIYLGNTTKEGFDDGNDWIASVDIEQVFDGQIAANVIAGEWLEITLDTAFQWDGTSNIVVAVNETTANWGSNPNWAAYTLQPTSGGKGIYDYRDGSVFDPASPPSGATVVNKVAQIQFDGDLQQPCAGTPDAGSVAVTAGMCAGQGFTLESVGVTTGASGLIGQWQSHEVGSPDPWIDITGATTNPYTIPSAPGIPMEYRYILSCGSDSDTTNIMTASINPSTQCYCIPKGTNSSYYIDNFTTTLGIQNVNNVGSGFSTDGYGQFLTDTVSQLKGESVNFNTSLKGGTAGFRIWVDWNQDGILDPNTEVAYQSTGYGSTQSGTITVPLLAVSGPTRMRIANNWLSSTGDTDPCDAALTNGEFEDYIFNVIVIGTPSITQSSGTPDCVSGTDLTATGTLEADETWYWQVAMDSTNMGNDASSDWTVYENGTYYVRTYNSYYGVWSDADSIEVTNVPSETAPPLPVAAQDTVCPPGTQVTVDPAPSGIEYYWQGTNDISSVMTDNASSPYNVTETGTYYVKAYNTNTQCWSEPVGVPVVVKTNIPNDPVVDPVSYNVCSGATSIEISGHATYLDSETTLDAASGGTYSCNGAGGGVMFNITNNQDVDITITALDILLSDDVNPTTKVFYKPGTFQGSEVNQYAWNLLGEYATNGLPNSLQYLDVDDFVIPAGETYGIYLNYEASFSLLSSAQTYSDANLTITAGTALCIPWDGINENFAFNGKVHYLPPASTDIKWYDAATGGNVVGSTNPLETVGTTVIPTVNEGTYEFYAASLYDGCESDNRVLVTVNIKPVNLFLSSIDASCSNGDNGSFAIDSVECGTSPFTFSIDGGTFGSIPNNLTAGDHTVIAKDSNGDESGEYTITINSAAGPSDVTLDNFTNEELTVSWTSNGSETSWNIEWGAPGFIPGTGAEIGSAVVGSSPYTITGLDGYTDYYVYVSADCGGATTPGDWSYVLATTDCDAMAAVGFCEDFEINSNLFCWRPIDNNNDETTWSTYVNNANSGNSAAGIETDVNAGNNDDYYIMPQMTLTGNEYLHYYYNTSGSQTNYQIVLSTTGRDPADFTNVVFADTVSNNSYTDVSVGLADYTGDVYIAFYIPPNALDGGILLIDDVCIEACTAITAGVDGSTDVCREDGTVDVSTLITVGDSTGQWEFPSKPSVISGSDIDVSSMPSGSYEAYYIVRNTCFSDTTVATIKVFGPSTAGEGNTIHACKNEPLDLFAALTGNLDMGGDWYDYNGNILPNSQPTSPKIQASYNYKYIVSNGVCDADTSIVEIIIDNCVWVGLDEEAFTNITVYPNPATDQINIVNPSNASNLKVELLDMNGRVVLSKANAMKNTTKATIAIDHLSKGVYTMRVYNDDGQKIFKVVKQ